MIENDLIEKTLHTALATGDLVMVAPLVSVSPVFVLLMSALVFRQETVGLRKVIGVALVVPGVVLITMLAR